MQQFTGQVPYVHHVQPLFLAAFRVLAAVVFGAIWRLNQVVRDGILDTMRVAGFVDFTHIGVRVMVQSYLETFPWDLMPADADALLGRLRGEVGITGLCVWAAARPATTLRVRNWQPRVFRSRGGIYFQVEKDRYEQTRCRPLISSWTHEGERFARILAAVTRHGLSLRLAVSAAATGRLAEHYPEFAARSVLGVESTRNLCLVHPDVQEYLIALVSDLSEQFSPAAIVLTDFATGWFDAWESDFDDGVLDPGARAACGLCFCGSCQQQAEEAGVDALAALEQGAAVVQDGISGEPVCGSAEAAWAAHAALAEFRRFQQERLNGLLRSLVEASAGELLLARRAQQNHPGPDVDASIVAALLSYVDGSADTDFVPSPKARRNEIALPVALGMGDRGPQLVASVQRAAAAGFSAVQLSHFGLLSDSMLQTVKQAVRFARRSAE